MAKNDFTYCLLPMKKRDPKQGNISCQLFITEMVQLHHRFLNSEGDSLAAMGKPTRKEKVRPLVVDSLAYINSRATKGDNKQIKNEQCVKKKVHFSETTSVLASITNARPRRTRAGYQDFRKQDAISALSCRVKAANKVARRPATDGGVLAVFTKTSSRCRKPTTRNGVLTEKSVTGVESSSIDPSQHLSIEGSPAHDGAIDNNNIIPESSLGTDGFPYFFVNSSENSDQGVNRKSGQSHRARKSKDTNVDELSKKSRNSRGSGLATLMEKLSLSSPSRVDRSNCLSIGSSDVACDIMLTLGKGEKSVSSPIILPVTKKQDRKKTPKKLDGEIPPVRTCLSPTLSLVRTTRSGSLESNCPLLDGSILNFETNAVNESSDQTRGENEPFRRSLRSRKPPNFFKPAIENAASVMETGVQHGESNTDESIIAHPISDSTSNTSKKTDYSKETFNLRSKVNDVEDLICALDENTIDEGLNADIGPLEKVEKGENMSNNLPQGTIVESDQSSSRLSVEDPSFLMGCKRSRRTRKPTAFYTPSASHRTRYGPSLSEQAFEESGEIKIQTLLPPTKNDSIHSENQHTRSNRSSNSSEWNEKDSRKNNDPVKCETDLKTGESTCEEDEADAMPKSSKAERKPLLNNNDDTIGLESKIEWLPQQLDQLKKAHRQTNPMSSAFWEQVATAVDGKSPGECRDQWYSLIKTPALKSKGSKITCKVSKSPETDDLFDSTPMRNVLDPTKMKTALLNIYAGIQIANRKVHVSNDEDTHHFEEFHGHSFQPKIGYKTYLQGMKRDISKETKNQKKGRKSKNSKSQSSVLHCISGSVKDSEVDMTARLTPGGSFRFQNRTHEEDDYWEDESLCED